MRIIVITNLYPPQELGGYGRCISDFVWGLLRNGHEIYVLTSNAPYLAPASNIGPNNEFVSRDLILKGSFEKGCYIETNASVISSVDKHNSLVLNELCCSGWDGCLLGNIDLLGISLVDILSKHNIPVLHHIGFIDPPYSPSEFPSHTRYSMAAASHSVRNSLLHHGFPPESTLVIYPGVRDDIFKSSTSVPSSAIRHSLSLHEAGHPIGSPSNPLRLGFAGLIMASKGLHPLIQAAIKLRSSGVSVIVNIAGSSFQNDYNEYLLKIISSQSLENDFFFYGQLSRKSLTRFWSLQHIGVFPSIHPEAFGISAAEIMCSGLLLCSTGVGGASEMFTHGQTGLMFKADNAQSLFQSICSVIGNVSLLSRISTNAHDQISRQFSVTSSVALIEDYFLAP